MMFFSQTQAEVIDYDNTTDIVNIVDDESYEDIEDIEDIIEDEELYPDGTVVKFKCTKTRGGKFVSWQIRSVVLMDGTCFDRTKISTVAKSISCCYLGVHLVCG